MSASKIASPVAAVAVVLSAGDVAIASAAKPGANNATLLKAIWSTRGNIYASIVGFEFGVAIIKSDLTGMLKNLPGAEAAPFTLTPRVDGGADLAPVA